MTFLLKEWLPHLFLALVYLLVLSVLKDQFNWFLVVGTVIGALLMDLDHLLYIFVTHPDHSFSTQARDLIARHNFGGLLDLYVKVRDEVNDLTLHSVLFQPILIVAALWFVTSSGNFFIQIMVLTMILHSLWDQFSDFREKGHLNNWFWPIQGGVGIFEQKIYLGVMILIFLLSSVILIA